MTSLPNPGVDTDWGRKLNDFLNVGHLADGTSKMVRDDYAPLTFGDPGKFLSLRRHVTTPGGSQSVAELSLDAHGTRAGGYVFGFISSVSDDSSVATTAPSVTNAANNGSGLIRITAAGHGFSTGDVVAVYGVGGVPNANGSWTITVINSSTFDLQGSVFAGAYTSGGKVTNRPGMYGHFVVGIPKQSRGSLTGTAAAGDDMNAYGAFNGSPNNSQATSAFLVNKGNNTAGNPEWSSGFAIEGSCVTGISLGGAISQYGIDFIAQNSGLASYGNGAIRLPNNVGVYARNAAGSGDIQLFHLSAADELRMDTTTRFLANVLMTDGTNIDIGPTNGTKIGLASSQKIGFWGVTPKIQPSGTPAAATDLATVIALANSLRTNLLSIGVVA